MATFEVPTGSGGGAFLDGDPNAYQDMEKIRQSLLVLGDLLALGQVETQRVANGLAGRGVYSGCVVTQDDAGVSMDLDITAGHIAYEGTGVLVTAGEVTVTAAHATLPRIDLVVVDSAGAKSVIAGTAALNPLAPTLPANRVILASVAVGAAVTTLANAVITDKRVRGRWPQRVIMPSDVVVNNSTTLVNATGMLFTVGNGESWVACVVAQVNTPTAADVKFDFTGPTATLRRHVWNGFSTGTAGAEGDYRSVYASFGTPVDMGGSATNAAFDGDVILSGATANGTVQLQFAQRVLTVGDTTMGGGSTSLIAEPVTLP